MSAALSIGFAELVMRTSRENYPIWTILGSLWANYAIWQTLRTETIIGMTVYLSFCTAMTRIAMSFYLGEHVTRGGWIALGLVSLATLSKRYL